MEDKNKKRQERYSQYKYISIQSFLERSIFKELEKIERFSGPRELRILLQKNYAPFEERFIYYYYSKNQNHFKHNYGHWQKLALNSIRWKKYAKQEEKIKQEIRNEIDSLIQVLNEWFNFKLYDYRWDEYSENYNSKEKFHPTDWLNIFKKDFKEYNHENIYEPVYSNSFLSFRKDIFEMVFNCLNELIVSKDTLILYLGNFRDEYNELSEEQKWEVHMKEFEKQAEPIIQKIFVKRGYDYLDECAREDYELDAPANDDINSDSSFCKACQNSPCI